MTRPRVMTCAGCGHDPADVFELDGTLWSDCPACHTRHAVDDRAQVVEVLRPVGGTDPRFWS